MSYAMRPDGSWRAVNSQNDVLNGEAWSETQPPIPDPPNPRITEIDLLLAAIDLKRARALSDAVLTGDKSHAQALEDQAIPLRAERHTLTN